jgi:hypothetical protein
MNGDHARTQSKHRATGNAARSHSTLSGVWPDLGGCPDTGRTPDKILYWALVEAWDRTDGQGCVRLADTLADHRTLAAATA